MWLGGLGEDGLLPSEFRPSFPLLDHRNYVFTGILPPALGSPVHPTFCYRKGLSNIKIGQSPPFL